MESVLNYFTDKISILTNFYIYKNIFFTEKFFLDWNG